MDDPDQARPDSEMLALLERLESRLLQLVLISGRDTEVLRERVPVPKALLIGNHGLEERRNGRSHLTDLAQPFALNLRRATDAVVAMPAAARPGVRIERKRASISAHFRESPDREATGVALVKGLRSIAMQEHLRVHEGRYVWELRPAVDVSKGTVVANLAQTLRPGALVYVGDDVTDADAFRAMRSLPATPTLAVGVRSMEVQPETFVDCDLVVDGVDGVKRFLSDLLAVG